jgi:hypothetical protein
MDMRWLTVTVVGFTLVIGGCSATEQQPAPPPAPPPAPAARALVAWAGKACEQVKDVDVMRSNFGQLKDQSFPPDAVAQIDGYVRQVSAAIGKVSGGLKELAPSGIQEADAFVATLLKAVDGVQAQMPQAAEPAEDKVTKIKQVAAAATAIEPQGPKLAGLAENTRDLVSSYNVAPKCDPVKQHDERARKLVAWANVMCETTKSLLAIDTKPLENPVFTDPKFARVVDIQLSMYLNSAADPVKAAVEKLAPLEPVGIKQADDFRAGLLAAAQAALPKLPERSAGSMLSPLPVEELKRQVAQVAQTLETVKPQQQPDLAAADPGLSIAYTLAPLCDPPKGAMPTASNGTDVKACESGKCQIQVTGSADVVMKGLKFKITVAASGATVTSDTGLLKLGTSGEGSFGDGGITVSFKLAGLQDTTAVVDITAS